MIPNEYMAIVKIGNQEIEDNGTYWFYNVEKPFPDGSIAIWDKILNKAINRNRILVINDKQVHPKQWKSKAKKIFRYFKQDVPMVLYRGKI